MLRYRSPKLVLSGSGAVAYSPVIAMAGRNSAGCSVVMLDLAGITPDVNVTLQASMDKENWSEPSIGPASSQDVADVGNVSLDPMTPILAPYIRLKFTLTGDIGIFWVYLTTYTN